MKHIYSFDLPEALIAQTPAHPRDSARLLVYERSTGTIQDSYFHKLCDFLPPQTLVVANNSKVRHCRYLFREGKSEIFAVETVNDHTVRALVRPGRLFKEARSIDLGAGLIATVMGIDTNGIRTIRFNAPLNDKRLLSAAHVPLPPYIEQNDELASEYQTIYAKTEGSLAAPTAGLHFSEELRDRVMARYGWEEITLEVGLGTFAPLTEENLKNGMLHEEKYYVSESAYKNIGEASHVTAVGTTTVRTLESVYRSEPHALSDSTHLFIQPGFQFKRVNALITNFHLPGTSLLLLVEAFIGSREAIDKVYSHAIKERYRFYSFGDAMLIL